MADDLNLDKTIQDDDAYAKENSSKANSSPVSLNEQKDDSIQNTYSLNTPIENQPNISNPILNALPPTSYETKDIPEENLPNNTSNEKIPGQNIPFDIESLLKSFSGNAENNTENSVPNDNTFNNQTTNNEESVPNQNQPNNNFLGGIFGNLLGGGTGNLSSKMSNLKTEDMILIGLFFFLMQEKEKNTELLIALALLFFMGLE